MKMRYREELPDGTPIYRQSQGIEYDSEVTPLVEHYSELYAKIAEGSIRTESGWIRTAEILDSDRKEMKGISKILREKQEAGGRGKNILAFASWNDKKFDNGKDNTVFVFGNGETKHAKYVYKEGIPEKSETGTGYEKMDGKNLRYLQNKYRLLRMYLGEIIPRSAFVLGETSRKRTLVPGLPGTDEVRQTVITIQKRIRGKNLQKMTLEEKLDKDFLVQLQKAHRQYVLLRIFVQTIADEMSLPIDTVDTKMDLGRLSNVDQIDIQNTVSMKEMLKSPNIMYDGERVYFIDLDQGKWNDLKEFLYQKLRSPEIRQRWEDAKRSMGIT